MDTVESTEKSTLEGSHTVKEEQIKGISITYVGKTFPTNRRSSGMEMYKNMQDLS